MEAVMLITVAIAVLVSIIVVALFFASLMLASVSMSGIQPRSFGKCLGSVILGTIAQSVISIPAFYFPLWGLFSTMLGVLVQACIVMGLFDTTFAKGFCASILYLIFSMAIAFMVFLTFGALGAAIAL